MRRDHEAADSLLDAFDGLFYEGRVGLSQNERKLAVVEPGGIIGAANASGKPLPRFRERGNLDVGAVSAAQRLDGIDGAEDKGECLFVAHGTLDFVFKYFLELGGGEQARLAALTAAVARPAGKTEFVRRQSLFELSDVDLFGEGRAFVIAGGHGIVQLSLAADELLDIGVARRPYLRGCPAENDFPFVNHGDRIGDAVRRGHIVGYHHRRHRELVAQAQDKFVDLIGHDRVERRRRFVIQHDFGFHDQRSGESDAAFHASR